MTYIYKLRNIAVIVAMAGLMTACNTDAAVDEEQATPTYLNENLEVVSNSDIVPVLTPLKIDTDWELTPERDAIIQTFLDGFPTLGGIGFQDINTGNRYLPALDAHPRTIHPTGEPAVWIGGYGGGWEVLNLHPSERPASEHTFDQRQQVMVLPAEGTYLHFSDRYDWPNLVHVQPIESFDQAVVYYHYFTAQNPNWVTTHGSGITRDFFDVIISDPVFFDTDGNTLHPETVGILLERSTPMFAIDYRLYPLYGQDMPLVVVDFHFPELPTRFSHDQSVIFYYDQGSYHIASEIWYDHRLVHDETGRLILIETDALRTSMNFFERFYVFDLYTDGETVVLSERELTVSFEEAREHIGLHLHERERTHSRQSSLFNRPWNFELEGDLTMPETGELLFLTPYLHTGRLSRLGVPSASTESAQSAPIALIAIDPGHQGIGNYAHEPNGPGSANTRAKVSTGTRGIYTGVPESELVLAVSLLLRDELEARGYEVLLVRDTQDVNISNAARARMATEAGADIMLRIHADGNSNQSVHGISTMSSTANNPYIPHLYADSHRLARLLVDETAQVTGARNRGIIFSDTLTGNNWSTIPVSVVEMGFMTNPEEDRNMQRLDYQLKLVAGMANAVDLFFEVN